MITSIALIKQLGLSRATLNNYIAQGLIPKPEVRREALEPGIRPTTLGYFPDWVLPRIKQIGQLKKSGMRMQAIQAQLANEGIPDLSLVKNSPVSIIKNDKKNTLNHEDIKSSLPKTSKNNRKPTDTPIGASQATGRNALQITPQAINYPAYMIDYHGDVIWMNDKVKDGFFHNQIPERAEGRSIFPLLFDWAKALPSADLEAVFNFHLHFIKSRFNLDNLHEIANLSSDQRRQLESSYQACISPDNIINTEPVIMDPDDENNGYRLIAMTFREGIFILYVPEQGGADDIIQWLSNRDSVIRTLLSQRLPTLTPLAVIVADLQQSVRICSELPAEEYFELINEIWSTLDPIFRQYYGAYGKHTGDGMLYYFFPQPDQNYLLNAVACAFSVKEAMKVINQEWMVKKGWTNELFMNIGLHSGEEWLGTFKSNTNLELVVLGETINTAARLSDFARFGQIWATKQLVSKVQMHERNSITFGIQKQGSRPRFVNNTFSLVEDLIDSPIENTKMSDIRGVAVTEIINFEDL